MITLLYAGLIAFHYQALSDAQRLFYNGQYDASSAKTVELRAQQPLNLAAVELRSSTLLFQLKAALGDPPDKDAAFASCARCPALMTAFLADTTEGQTLARARLAENPADDAARFFLGKLDLNYVWLQLGELGHRTGWNEYWEARKSLDAVLLRNCPFHALARSYPDLVCSMNLQLLAGLVEALGCASIHAELAPDDTHCCVRLMVGDEAAPSFRRPTPHGK